MTAPPAPAVRPRRPLLWVGAVLWVGVFVALGAVFLLRGDRSEPPGPETKLVAAQGGEAGARLLPNGVEPKPEPVYDPEGLPPFSLTERRGEVVTNETLKGSPFIAGFVFTRCASKCPLVTKVMGDLRGPLEGSGVKLVSISVDPKYDTPEVLTNYADFFDAVDDPDWLFLTGPEDEIYELVGEGFKQPVSRNADADDPGWAVYHTFNLMLVGPDGVVRGKYNSQNPGEMAKLRHEARALAEASNQPPEQTADDETAE